MLSLMHPVPHPAFAIESAFAQNSGIPLVMLHGVLGQASNWSRLQPQLPVQCCGKALNYPLFEQAPRLDSLTALVDYTAGYIETLNAPHVILAGNSIGGHVALHLALRLPGRVRGLILTGSSGLLERNFGTVPGLRPSRAWIADRVREVFFDPACVSEDLIDEVASILHNRACLQRLVRLFLSAREDNIAPNLLHVQCPTLLIWGRDDIVTPLEAGRQFHALLSDSELHILERCGHAPMIEHPQSFAKLLDSWWRRRISSEAGQLASVA